MKIFKLIKEFIKEGFLGILEILEYIGEKINLILNKLFKKQQVEIISIKVPVTIIYEYSDKDIIKQTRIKNEKDDVLVSLCIHYRILNNKKLRTYKIIAVRKSVQEIDQILDYGIETLLLSEAMKNCEETIEQIKKDME